MGLFGSVGKFFSNAAKTAGKPFHSVAKGISKVTKSVAKEVGKVPLVGPALKTTFDIALVAPFSVTEAVMSGQRIDKVAVNHFKHQLSNIKDIAPYAQAVVSLAPGVGSGISGVIGAGVAISEGKPVTEALEKGVIDMTPGGPIAQGIARASVSAMKGKNIKDIGIDALPIPETQRKLIKNAIDVTKRISSGQKVDKALISSAENAFKALPKDMAKALQTGLAVGEARKLQQKIMAAAPTATNELYSRGKTIIQKDKVLTAVAKNLKDKSGFAIGTGIMMHSGVSPAFIAKTRKGLAKGEQLKGFDMALATHIGRVTSPPKLNTISPEAAAGYYITRGIVGASKKQQKGIIKAVTSVPSMKVGALDAAKELRAEGIWPKIKRFFGI